MEELYTVFSCFRHIFLAAKIKLNIFGVVWESFIVLQWKKTVQLLSVQARGVHSTHGRRKMEDGRGSNVQCVDVCSDYVVSQRKDYQND